GRGLGVLSGAGLSRHARDGEGQRLPRRPRRGAADHHGVAKDLLEGRRVVRRDRGLTGEDAAEEPARAVDADEAGGAVPAASVLRADRQAGEKFGAEGSLDLVRGPALLGDGCGDLFAQLTPDTGVAGG